MTNRQLLKRLQELATEHAEISATARSAILQQQEEIGRLCKELAQLKRLLNPRLWTQAESSAWHRAIPDLYGAFEALRASRPQPREHET